MGIRRLASCTLTVLILLSYAVFSGACGGHGRSTSSILSPNAAHPRSMEIGEALAELDAMQAPEGVNSEVFQQLKDALRTALVARGEGKLIASPPAGPNNAIPDFAVTNNGDGTFHVAWHYYNIGDYNQDGVVSIADITPLAMHYGETWSKAVPLDVNTIAAVVDGSNNEKVDIADVTPIAMYFGSEVTHYSVQTSDSETGTYTEHASTTIDEAIQGGRGLFEMNLSGLTVGYWVKAVPGDSSDNEGVCSNVIQVSAANQPPVAALDSDVTSGLAPLTVNFDASGSHDDDGTIANYQWDWEGDGVYDFDSGTNPLAQHIYPVGDYNATVLVTDDGGATATASLVITANDASLIPEPPTNVQASDTTFVDSIQISWDAPASGPAPDGYNIYRSDTETGAYVAIDTAPSSPYDDSAVPDYGTYWYKVSSYNAEGESALAGPDSGQVADAGLTWTHTWGGPDGDDANAVAVDIAGNTYVTAEIYSFGAGNSDIATLKYNPAGDLVWARTWGGLEDDYGAGIAVDSSSNVYVCGETDSFGTGGSGGLLLKYDHDGNLLWQKVWGATGNTNFTAMTIDENANVYMVGFSYGLSAGDPEVVVCKFDTDGEIQWAKQWGGTAEDLGWGIAYDGVGSIYVTGGTSSYGVGGSSDSFLLKYDLTGVLIWQKVWGGSNYEVGIGVSADSTGFVCVTGNTASFGEVNGDVILLRYDQDGALIWQSTWGGAQYDCGLSVAIDSSWNTYVSGYTYSYGTAGQSGILLKYDIDGNLALEKIWGNAGSNEVPALTMDAGGMLYLAGCAPDNNSTWQDVIGTITTPTGTEAEPTGTDNSISLTVDTPDGIETNPVGTTDTGGGNGDILTIKLDPSAM
jgi:hypothetical protein